MANTVLVASDSRLKRFNRASVELLSSMRFAIALLTIISIASFTQLMPVLAIVSLMVLVSALSSGILPPVGMLFILAILMGTVIYLLRKQLMKIHTRLQVALTESFKENSQTPQP